MSGDTGALPPRAQGRSLRGRILPVADRWQLGVFVLLAVVTAAAWALTVYQARTMDMPMGVVVRGGAGATGGMTSGSVTSTASDAMADMASSGMAGMDWSWSGLSTFLVAWAVMMAAMMLPAATPMLLLFRTVARGRVARGQALVPTWVFAAGYLLVWTAIGAATWGAIRGASDLAGRLDAGDRTTWAPIALGAVVMVAGAYQFTPLKSICLRHCQSPLGFVVTHWRDGRLGALRMGIVHGAYCLGCCWALFAVLVAAGVMSLAWMLVLTLVVVAEKVFPAGERTARMAGAVLLALGALVATGSTAMPWAV